MKWSLEERPHSRLTRLTSNVNATFAVVTQPAAATRRKRRLNQRGFLVLNIRTTTGLQLDGVDSSALRPFLAVSFQVEGKSAQRWRTRVHAEGHKSVLVWDEHLQVPAQRASEILGVPLWLEAFHKPSAGQRSIRIGGCCVATNELEERRSIPLKSYPLYADEADAAEANAAPVGMISVEVAFEMDGVSWAFPSPVAATASAAFREPPPVDASRIALCRDALLRALEGRIFQALSIVFVCGVVTFILMIGLLLPMLLGIVPWGSLGFGAATEQAAWTFGQQCLTGLFTYQNLISVMTLNQTCTPSVPCP